MERSLRLTDGEISKMVVREKLKRKWALISRINEALYNHQDNDQMNLRSLSSVPGTPLDKKFQRLDAVLNIVVERSLLFDVSYQAKGAIIANYNNEPARAVCDSVGYIRLPSAFKTIRCSSAFNVIAPPSKPASQKFENSSDTALLYDGRAARKLDLNDPTDIFATAQDFVGDAMAQVAEAKTLHLQDQDKDAGSPTPSLTMDPTGMHSINYSVLLDAPGIDEDNMTQTTTLSPKTIDMRTGMILLFFKRLIFLITCIFRFASALNHLGTQKGEQYIFWDWNQTGSYVRCGGRKMLRSIGDPWCPNFCHGYRRPYRWYHGNLR